MNPEMNISMLPTVTMLLMLIGLIFAVLSDHYIKRAHRIIMLIIASLVILLVMQNVVEFILENYYVHPIARTMNSIIGYSILPLEVFKARNPRAERQQQGPQAQQGQNRDPQVQDLRQQQQRPVQAAPV